MILKKLRAKWHTDIEILLENNSFLMQNIYAMNMNYMLNLQGVDWKKQKNYQFYEKLHTILKVYSADENEMVRVGKDYDGGYVMVLPLSENKIAYSFGIANDVSWDSAMADYGYDIYMYDHTIARLPYEKSQFHWKKNGIAGKSEGELKSLDDLLKENGHASEHGMVLKMDVEGAEWGFLNSISIETLDRFDQIVFELHGLNNLSNYENILTGIEKICTTHYCVHIHGNNSGNVSYCGKYVTPDTLEITMLRKYGDDALHEEEGTFPKPIDMPCVPWVTDVQIGRWN